jgi:D-alanyl-D-alanine carboxypeptidase
MLVRSGNDAAVAIAEHFGGSVEGFCALMNQRAQELGMYDTFFVNPNGMPDRPLERHNSTAFDLAILAREAMTHAEFRSWVATSELTYDTFGDREDVTFESTNHLLEEYPLCDGIKTGYTDRAGFCLVASATYRGKTLIAVVLGCERNQQWPQAIELFDYGFTLYDPDYESFRELFDMNIML